MKETNCIEPYNCIPKIVKLTLAFASDLQCFLKQGHFSENTLVAQCTQISFVFLRTALPIYASNPWVKLSPKTPCLSVIHLAFLLFNAPFNSIFPLAIHIIRVICSNAISVTQL